MKNRNILERETEIQNAVRNLGLTHTHSLTRNHSSPQLTTQTIKRPSIRTYTTQLSSNSITHPSTSIIPSSSITQTNSHSSDSQSQQPHQPTLPIINISAIEPYIDYTPAIDDILNPPPAFTVPSFPPPIGSPPAAQPSDISFGYLGRPNSPPPSYPQHQVISENSREILNHLNSSQDQNHVQELDLNPDWDLNLPLQDRISNWLNRSGYSQKFLPTSPHSSSPTHHLVYEQQGFNNNETFFSKYNHLKNTIWVPIRLVMDQPDDLNADQADTEYHHNEKSRSEGPSTTIKTDKETDINQPTNQTNQSISSYNLKGKNVDHSESSSITARRHDSSANISSTPFIAYNNESDPVDSSLSGFITHPEGSSVKIQSITSRHLKGKDVDRGAQLISSSNENHHLLDHQLVPATSLNLPSRPLPSIPPPLPPRRLHRQANVKLTRRPPPPVPPKRNLEKGVENNQVATPRTTPRPPPLPPKRNFVPEGSSLVDNHSPTSPSSIKSNVSASLPASPAEVNRMLRRGSSLRSKNQSIITSDHQHPNPRGHQPHLSLSCSEDLFQEEQAFNRRSLPAIPESNIFDSCYPSSSSLIPPSLVSSSSSSSTTTTTSSQQQELELVPQQQAGVVQQYGIQQQTNVPENHGAERRDEIQQAREERILSEYTELDLLLLRIERSRNDGTAYEDLNLLQEILGQHHSTNNMNNLITNSNASFTNLNHNNTAASCIQFGNIQLVSKRIDKFGKVKLKFSLLGHRCNKCVICLHQFKVDQSAALLPCTHVFHQDCLINWLKIKNQCPLCKFNVF